MIEPADITVTSKRSLNGSHEERFVKIFHSHLPQSLGSYYRGPASTQQLLNTSAYILDRALRCRASTSSETPTVRDPYFRLEPFVVEYSKPSRRSDVPSSNSQRQSTQKVSLSQVISTS
jgi:hypothetical protein